MAYLKSPCIGRVNKWNNSFRPCLWVFRIARPNIPNKTSFHFVLSFPHHKRHKVWHVYDRSTPCLQGNLYTQPCLFDLGTAQECTQRNKVCPPRFGNNQLGNFCTFQSRVHLEIDLVCNGNRLSKYRLICLTFGTHLDMLNIILTTRCCIALIHSYCIQEDL